MDRIHSYYKKIIDHHRIRAVILISKTPEGERTLASHRKKVKTRRQV